MSRAEPEPTISDSQRRAVPAGSRGTPGSPRAVPRGPSALRRWLPLWLGLGALSVGGGLVLVVVRLGVEGAYPLVPLEFSEAPPDAEAVAARVASRLESADPEGEFECEELTCWAQSRIAGWIAAGEVGAGSRIGIEAAGPRLDAIRVRLSIELTSRQAPALVGRFLNLDVTLRPALREGRVERFELDRYRFGDYEGVPTRAETPGLLTRLATLDTWPTPLRRFLERIETLSVQEGRVHLALRSERAP